MRCSTSGRLTPAAPTRISTSPGPGCGTAALDGGTSTSGPPGALIATAVIIVGTLLTCSRSLPPKPPPLLTGAGRCGQHYPLAMDEDLPRRRNDALDALVKQPLDPLSIDELNADRALEGEIARTKAHMAAASGVQIERRGAVSEGVNRPPHSFVVPAA